MNVFCAGNEHGKSTCFDALHALFFQPHTGTPGAVQSLRPYSGGSPSIEADIVTADGRYRLSKQFYGGKRARVVDIGTGRLVGQADEAEKFIEALVRGNITRPAGLLWVRQGNTGVEKRSKSEEESEKRAREGVLSSVQGEVEALTGGRRMVEAMAACEEELSRLVTLTGRPKAGGLYASAIEERDGLAVEERRLEEEVQNLREALDTRRKAKKRLSELQDPEEAEARRQRQHADAQAALSEALEQVEALSHAAPDIVSAEAAVKRARSVAEAATNEIHELGMQIADLNGRIAARSEDALEEAWRETADAHREAAARVARIEREIAVLQTLRTALESARVEARDHYFEPVLRELRPLMGLLFYDAEVVFDDGTLLPRKVHRNGQEEDVERLSGGMREQLTVLTRLAFARLLASDGHPTPVVLDDALVYSDDDRIEKMFDALHRQGRDQQIIVFSCRQRAFSGLALQLHF